MSGKFNIKLTDEEKIADLNALFEEAEQGEAEPLEPLKDRLQRLHACYIGQCGFPES